MTNSKLLITIIQTEIESIRTKPNSLKKTRIQILILIRIVESISSIKTSRAWEVICFKTIHSILKLNLSIKGFFPICKVTTKSNTQPHSKITHTFLNFSRVWNWDKLIRINIFKERRLKSWMEAWNLQKSHNLSIQTTYQTKKSTWVFWD